MRVLCGRRLAAATSSGLIITPHAAIAALREPLDTLIVAGGAGHARGGSRRALLDWIIGASRRARRTASVCTGAFLLARRDCSTAVARLRTGPPRRRSRGLHPAFDVDPDPIFVRDGALWTSAGVTAGMDLALALVEEDLDRDAALMIARHLVLFLRRPGNQSQFSATLAAQQPEREPLREIQRWCSRTSRPITRSRRWPHART